MRYFSKDAPASAQEHVLKFGRNAAVPNGSWAPVVTGGALNWLTAADNVRVKAGGNSNDTAAGTGARSVVVEGLDENWEVASETLTTAGASASSSSSTTFIRVFRAYVATVGAYGGSNADDIEIETDGGTSMITIPQAQSQSQHCAYTVPAGYSARIVRAFAEVPSSKDADLELLVRMQADVTTPPCAPARVVGYRDGISSDVREAVYVEGQDLPEKTDIWMQAWGNGTGVAVSGEFDLYLMRPMVPGGR